MMNKLIEDVNEQNKESKARVKEIDEEKAQELRFQDLVEQALECKIDPKILKKVKYNALNAKNAAANPDVAEPNDRSNAEDNIKNCNVNLIESVKKSESIKDACDKELSLDRRADALRRFVNFNKNLCEIAIEYSDSVVKGEFDANLENRFNMELQNQDNPYSSLKNEEVVEAEPEKVTAEEDYMPEVELDFGSLDQELENELNNNDNNEVEVTLDNIDGVDDITAEITPIETTEENDLNNTIETTSLFAEDAPLEEEEEQPLTMENNDSELIKVVDIEEVGAPVLDEEEENTKSRKRAA